MRSSWLGGALFLCALALPTVVALGEAPEAKDTAGNGATDAKTPSTPADDARRARVFATVGDVTITVGDLEDGINSRSPYARKRFAEPEVVRDYADAQVETELLAQGAEQLGLADDPEVRTFLDRTIMQMFVQQEIELGKPIESITREQVKAYYDDHPEEFRRPEMRRASHILVGDKQEAEALIADLASSNDKTFGTIAKDRSLDTETKLRGGDLLYFTVDGTTVGSTSDAGVDARLVKAAFALSEKGQVTKRPIDMGDGRWSVLRLTAIRPEKVEKLEDAANGIQRRLWREDRKAAMDTLLVELRETVQPKSYPERLDAIVFETQGAPVDPPSQ